MDFTQARSALIKLLCVSVDSLNVKELSKLVKKRFLLWHPDKNAGNDVFCENFRTLHAAWTRFKLGRNWAPPESEEDESDGPGLGAEDLFCHEQWDPDWETDDDEDTEYNSTPFDDDFFNASPTKNFAVPEPLRLFFRSKSNRRAGTYHFNSVLFLN